MDFKPRTYNPLDYDTISESMATALMDSPLIDLEDVAHFYGNGVYSLFYTGSFAPYRALSNINNALPGSWPIYIGKAAPNNRKGDIDTSIVDTPEAGSALFERTQDHLKSIRLVDNLNPEDFQIRLMVCSYMWVPMVETALIARYIPIWNAVLDGFGNHDPGGRRVGGKMSKWDTLHPGRPWVAARKLAPAVPQNHLEQEVVSELDTVYRRVFKDAP